MASYPGSLFLITPFLIEMVVNLTGIATQRTA
nr:MAG TPA_asm: hypothetical protein [Caudoviricetes sp.]